MKFILGLTINLVSLNVVSLLTNVPANLVIENIGRRWNNISKNIKIPKKEFFITIKLILESTYFSFNKRFYRQVFNFPMDSSLSPITNIVMKDLEEKASQLLLCRLFFYLSYVDNMLLVTSPEAVSIV